MQKWTITNADLCCETKGTLRKITTISDRETMLMAKSLFCARAGSWLWVLSLLSDGGLEGVVYTLRETESWIFIYAV